MLTTGAGLVADDLERYGELAAAAWVLTCSEEELVRICTVADWLLYNGPRRASGASMLIAKACALAAVHVQEGRPRDLTRSRRGPVTGPRPDDTWRRPDHRLHESVAADYGVGPDARAFWGQPTPHASDPPTTTADKPQSPRPMKPRTPKSPSPAAVLAKTFHLRMAQQLSVFGFVSRAGALFTVPVNPDTTGWLTLATTTYRGSGQVNVTANVGVLHHRIHRLLHRLEPDLPKSRYYPPTIFSSLDTLAPDPTSPRWLRQESDLDRFTLDLTATIRDDAIPFMHRHQTLDQIITALQLEMVFGSIEAAERLAAALLVAGEPAAALAELDAYTASITQRNDAAAANYRNFHDAFRHHAST